MALALCSAAWAEPKFTEAQVMGRLHAELDLDGDGEVSLSEFEEVGHERHFTDLDRDGSGGFNVRELQNWIMLTPPRPERSQAIKPVNQPVQAQPADSSSTPVQPPSPDSPPIQGGTQVAPPRSVPPPPPQPQPVPVLLPQASGPSNLQIAAVMAGVVGLAALFAGVWVSRGGSSGRRRRRRR